LRSAATAHSSSAVAGRGGANRNCAKSTSLRASPREPPRRAPR
jgi:hypothetical protein